MSEYDHRIQNRELAEVMAYAEDPYREVAFQAIQRQLPEGYVAALIDSANEASNAVGKQYIAELSINLTYHERETSQEALPEREVHATHPDMMAFALRYEDPKAAQGNMKRLWSAFSLADTYVTSQFPGHFIKGPHHKHRDLQELREVILTQALVDASVNLRNIGPKQHALLQAYYSVRAAQAAEESSESR